ncbi:protein FAM234B isoform X1 [Cygnus olor]|uniref:protein FAM234B isoform X1 n=1 Tax=Cygnus olor TaxID=8869 RepID=UPI001ADE9D01|nr:protein FAM234B isoform X1 [Cygnus olor]
MATVLSRALKLPGKKSPDLGEYDPLTQADSDESEDDLVLNIQKNGGVKNGKSPPEEVQDPDSDVEVGMTKQRTSESAPEGYPAEAAGSLEQKAAPSLMPYLRTAVFLLTVVISMILVLVCAFLIPCPPRDLHNTWNRNLGQGTGGVLSPLELCDVNGDGLPDILIVFTALMNASVMGVSRPSVTVVALSGMNGSTLWSIQLPEETRSVQCKGLSLGTPAEPTCLVTGTSKFLSLLSASTGKTIWTLNSIHLSDGILAAPAATLPDVDGDGVRDIVVLALKETQPDVFFVLVSGKTGTALGGPVKYNINGEGKVIGPQVHITSRGAIYILFGFGKTHLASSVLHITEKTFFLPKVAQWPWDVCTIPCNVKSGSREHEKESHCHDVKEYQCLFGWNILEFPEASSASGTLFQGTLSSFFAFCFVWPFTTTTVVQRTLCTITQLTFAGMTSCLRFLAGNVQAVALRDIFTQARNRDSFPAMLQQEEPEWEKRRSVNLSELIDIYSGGVEFLMKTRDTNCSNLLITSKEGLILLQGQDLEPRWTLDMQNISSQPVPGYFSADQTLDFMLQALTGDGNKKVVVIDGKSGIPVWNQELPWQKQQLDALSVMTLDKKSVFLFWADEAQPVLQSLQPGPRSERPGLHHLYLLHPVFPTVLLDLTNVTDKVIASAIGINDLQKDAFHITVTTTATSEKQPGFLSVSKLGLKWAMMTQGRMVWLKDSTTPKISRGEVRRFLARLKFVDFPHKL